MGHNNEHSHQHHHISGKNIGIAVFLNIFITIAQLIGGIISGSVALITDALHNFSDVVSLLLSFYTNRLAKKDRTNNFTYGYKRAEILSAFINSITLIAIAIFLIIEAIKRFFNPEPILSDLVIYFALGSIIINVLSVLILHKEAKENINIKSAYLHLLTDVMTSIAVMFGGIIMKYTNIFWIDSLLSIIIAFYLIFSSYKLLLTSIKILMQATPENVDIIDIRDQILCLKKVDDLKNIHLWQLDDKESFFEANIFIKNDILLSDFEKIMIEIKKILENNNIKNYNIQPNIAVLNPQPSACNAMIP